MRFAAICTIAFFVAIVIPGCRDVNPGAVQDNTGIAIQSLSATPTAVGPGATSLITCRAVSINGGELKYSWEASGAYGYLLPMDSACVFSSPSCHYGPATVTVTVSDSTGALASGSVNLN